MKTVKIIFGSYGLPNGKLGVKLIDRGQTCEIEDAEADRLIALGVAELVAETPHEPQEAVATGEDIPEEETQQEAFMGHLDPEQLSAMTNASLKKLAEDMGLDASKCKVKADYVALISAVEFPVDPEDADEYEDDVEDGEAPPDLTVEAPVV